MLTPLELAALRPEERTAYAVVADLAGRGETACGVMMLRRLLATIERLARPAAELTAEGAGPLLDRACREGRCGDCIGDPCEHGCGHPSRPEDITETRSACPAPPST